MLEFIVSLIQIVIGTAIITGVVLFIGTAFGILSVAEFKAIRKDASPKHATIFDQVAADLHLDPRNIVRSRKEQDAADNEFFDKIEEYRNGITG